MSETPTDRVELTEDEREWMTRPLPTGTSKRELSDEQAEAILFRATGLVAARVQALTAERDEKGCPTHVLLDPECVKCAYHAYHRANASLQTACNQREELRAELARWVEDWGSFTPGECAAGIHPDFAFDHEDSVTCPICAADKWKSEHDLSASITHQLQIETDRLQAELASANARIRELEERLAARKEACEKHSQSESRWWGKAIREGERADALQATLDRVTALADEWEREARHWTDQAEAMAGDKRAKSYALASKYQLHADRVRAALTPEGKP